MYRTEFNMPNRNKPTTVNANRNFSDALIAKTVARINEEFEKQGNGAIINHKNGNTYAIWCQNCGTYLIEDNHTVWEVTNFSKTVPTIEDLARVILSI